MTNDERLAFLADRTAECELLERQILMPRLPSEKQQLVDRIGVLREEIAELQGDPPLSAAAA